MTDSFVILFVQVSVVKDQGMLYQVEEISDDWYGN